MPAHRGRLAVCWQLPRITGLAIATLMQTAQRDIVDASASRHKVDAGTTGARTTAAVLAGLLLLGVGLGELIGAEPVRFLLGPVGRCACWWSPTIAPRRRMSQSVGTPLDSLAAHRGHLSGYGHFRWSDP